MDAESLTLVLRKNGHLRDATVVSVGLIPFETNGIGSEFLIADVRYSSSAQRLPERMVVKRPLLGDRGQGEANVYELLLSKAPGLPTMRYFGALDEGPDEPLSLLFEDLSNSHTQTPWPIIPNLTECKQAVAALASIHAYWWGTTDSIVAGIPPVVPHQDPDRLAKCFPEFAGFVGEYLSPARVEHYERIFEPQRAARRSS